MISAGVFFGAPNAVPRAGLIAGQEIGHRGQVRQDSDRVVLVTARPRSLPDLTCSAQVGDVVEHHMHLPRNQIGERWRPTAIGHMNHVDAGEHLEQFADIWMVDPLPEDAMLSLPGLAFGVSDQFGN